MQLVDTLRFGGAERVAVNLANLLPQDRFQSFLCSTRAAGPLEECVAPQVGRLALSRRSTVDLGALLQASRFVRQNRIQLLHAHATALFFARMLAALPPFPKVIWHDHYGRYAFNDRPVWLYKAATRGIGAVISVNQPLETWARETLGIPADRAGYIPNLVEMSADLRLREPLPGVSGRRLVCVANMRPQKDHPTLLAAMRQLMVEFPDLQLLLAGVDSDPEYGAKVRAMIGDMGLAKNVTHLGARSDVAAILHHADIAVLPSQSEGLPLALLEYGMAGLPVVATAVGQCPEVLDDGRCGILIPPASPDQLAASLRHLLLNPASGVELGQKLKQHVLARYSASGVMAQVCRVYDKVLGLPAAAPATASAIGAAGGAR